MSTGMGSPPPGGDYNRASQVYAFTWTLAILSIIFVTGRMYSRVKLTRSVWWDDRCVCIALVSHDTRKQARAKLIGLVFQHCHLGDVQCLCRKRLCKTSALSYNHSANRRLEAEHNISVSLRIWYRHWEGFSRILDREDRRTQQLAKMDATVYLNKHHYLRCRRYHTIFCPVPAGQSGMG